MGHVDAEPVWDWDKGGRLVLRECPRFCGGFPARGSFLAEQSNCSIGNLDRCHFPARANYSTQMGSIEWPNYSAVLFDLDGVITPTADVHERAWARLFDKYDYTADDYLTYIDGKPRYEGVESFLESRGVTLPFGDPSDAPGTETLCAQGNSKNDLFISIIEKEGVAPYPGSIAFCDMLDAIAMPQAIVSSSRNAVPVLQGAGLGDRFGLIVDGLVAADKGLPGKPQPDTFVFAAQQLGVDVATTIVVEDATAGVAAASSGGFGLVLGVNRGAGRDKLTEAGADVVVDDLHELVDGGQS